MMFGFGFVAGVAVAFAAVAVYCAATSYSDYRRVRDRIDRANEELTRRIRNGCRQTEPESESH